MLWQRLRSIPFTEAYVAQMIFQELDPFIQNIETQTPAEPKHRNIPCRRCAKRKSSGFVARTLGEA